MLSSSSKFTEEKNKINISYRFADEHASVGEKKTRPPSGNGKNSCREKLACRFVEYAEHSTLPTVDDTKQKQIATHVNLATLITLAVWTKVSCVPNNTDKQKPLIYLCCMNQTAVSF